MLRKFIDIATLTAHLISLLFPPFRVIRSRARSPWVWLWLTALCVCTGSSSRAWPTSTGFRCCSTSTSVSARPSPRGSRPYRWTSSPPCCVLLRWGRYGCSGCLFNGSGQNYNLKLHFGHFSRLVRPSLPCYVHLRWGRYDHSNMARKILVFEFGKLNPMLYKLLKV